MIVENHDAPYCFAFNAGRDRSRHDRKNSLSARPCRVRQPADFRPPNPPEVTFHRRTRKPAPPRVIVKLCAIHIPTILPMVKSQLLPRREIFRRHFGSDLRSLIRES